MCADHKQWTLVNFIMFLKLSTCDAAPFNLHPRHIIPTALRTPLVAGCTAGNFRKIISFNIHDNPGREACFSSSCSQMRKLRYPPSDFRAQL